MAIFAALLACKGKIHSSTPSVDFSQWLGTDLSPTVYELFKNLSPKVVAIISANCATLGG